MASSATKSLCFCRAFFDRTVAASGFYHQVNNKTGFVIVERGNYLFGVNNFDVGIDLNVFAGYNALAFLTIRTVCASSP